MQHMAKYDSPTKGKDGTSHFGVWTIAHRFADLMLAI